jgi:hypothetical protein
MIVTENDVFGIHFYFHNIQLSVVVPNFLSSSLYFCFLPPGHYGNDELDAGKHWWHTRYFVHTSKNRQLAVR